MQKMFSGGCLWGLESDEMKWVGQEIAVFHNKCDIL